MVQEVLIKDKRGEQMTVMSAMDYLFLFDAQEMIVRMIVVREEQEQDQLNVKENEESYQDKTMPF